VPDVSAGPDQSRPAALILGAVAASGGGHIDRGGRLAVHLDAADRPVEQVLQAAGHQARVFGGAEQHYVSGAAGSSQAGGISLYLKSLNRPT